MKRLEILFSPAEFAALKERNLSQTVCVVFDVLRATTTMITALANGAKAIIPVSEISEALAIRQRQPEVLLAGERSGLLIRADLTGSVDFDLGNSPREFAPDKVTGKTIVITTTNGTRALRACAKTKATLACSFANLTATADFIGGLDPGELLLVCAGTHEEAAYEDTLAAGALSDLLWSGFSSASVADSAQIARQIYLSARDNLLAAVQQHSRNARRLLAIPDLSDDVSFCFRRDNCPLLAHMQSDGAIVRKQ